MSEISSLQSRADEINRSLDVWNNVYVWGLVAALIAGSITLLASYNVISKNRKLAPINADIGRFKDKQLEDEKSNRLEIERALAPRIITLKYFGGEKQSNFDALKPFAGTPVIIRFVDTKDGEPERAAQNIAALVNASGWGLVKFSKVSLNLSAGLKIAIDNPKLAVGGTMLNTELQELKSFKAAKALSDFLTNINWEVEILSADIYSGLEEFEQIPKDGIRVIVGPKPEWQFIPQTPSEKAFAEEMKKFGVKMHP